MNSPESDVRGIWFLKYLVCKLGQDIVEKIAGIKAEKCRRPAKGEHSQVEALRRGLLINLREHQNRGACLIWNVHQRLIRLEVS